MQGIYTHIPETNYVPREYGVATILLFLFMVLIIIIIIIIIIIKSLLRWVSHMERTGRGKMYIQGFWWET